MYISRRHGRCAYCNSWNYLTRDHLIPKSKGGKIILLVCTECNNSKGNKSLKNWLEDLSELSPQHIYASRFLNIKWKSKSKHFFYFAQKRFYFQRFTFIHMPFGKFSQISELTYDFDISWTIENENICFSDGFQCRFIHFFVSEREIKLVKDINTEIFIQDYHWFAKCSLEIKEFNINLGNEKNPFLLDSSIVPDFSSRLYPLRFGRLIQRIRQEMTHSINLTQLQNYYHYQKDAHEKKNFTTKTQEEEEWHENDKLIFPTTYAQLWGQKRAFLFVFLIHPKKISLILSKSPIYITN